MPHLCQTQSVNAIVLSQLLNTDNFVSQRVCVKRGKTQLVSRYVKSPITSHPPTPGLSTGKAPYGVYWPRLRPSTVFLGTRAVSGLAEGSLPSYQDSFVSYHNLTSSQNMAADSSCSHALVNADPARLFDLFGGMKTCCVYHLKLSKKTINIKSSLRLRAALVTAHAWCTFPLLSVV